MYLSHPCYLASVHQSASVRVGRFHGSSVVKEYFLPLNTALFWDATNTIRYIRHKRTHKSQLQQPACKAVIKCAVPPFFIYHMFPLPIFISKFKRTATSFEKRKEIQFRSPTFTFIIVTPPPPTVCLGNHGPHVGLVSIGISGQSGPFCLFSSTPPIPFRISNHACLILLFAHSSSPSLFYLLFLNLK